MTEKVIEREKMVINGLDMQAVRGLYTLLEDHTEGGRVTFSTNSHWQDGTRVFTRIGGFQVDGNDVHQQERRFVALSDEPLELGGTDTTEGPVEALMHAVAGCVAATTNLYAALQDVELTSLEISIESDVNLHGMFGLDHQTRPGIGNLRISTKIGGNAEAEKLREIARQGYSFSPVRDSVEKGVSFTPNIKVVSS